MRPKRISLLYFLSFVLYTEKNCASLFAATLKLNFLSVQVNLNSEKSLDGLLRITCPCWLVCLALQTTANPINAGL